MLFKTDCWILVSMWMLDICMEWLLTTIGNLRQYFEIGKTIKKQIYTAILSPLLSQMTVITFPSWFTETKNETCNSYDHQDDHCYLHSLKSSSDVVALLSKSRAKPVSRSFLVQIHSDCCSNGNGMKNWISMNVQKWKIVALRAEHPNYCENRSNDSNFEKLERLKSANVKF